MAEVCLLAIRLATKKADESLYLHGADYNWEKNTGLGACEGCVSRALKASGVVVTDYAADPKMQEYSYDPMSGDIAQNLWSLTIDRVRGPDINVSLEESTQFDSEDGSFQAWESDRVTEARLDCPEADRILGQERLF